MTEPDLDERLKKIEQRIGQILNLEEFYRDLRIRKMLTEDEYKRARSIRTKAIAEGRLAELNQIIAMIENRLIP